MRLELAENLSVPGEFDLEVPHKGRTYRARLVWRGAVTSWAITWGTGRAAYSVVDI